jgi:DNA-binding transcriptional MerR regulator
MEFQWKHAKDLFSKLETPDYGTTEGWSSWHEQAWGHLTKAGLTTVATPLDLTRIKLRIAATCWLTLDFVAAMQSDEYCNVFYWSDWISELQIEPLCAMATAMDDKGLRRVIKDYMDDPETEHEVCDEGGIIFYDDDLSRHQDAKVVAAAAGMQRNLVRTALINELNGSHELFLGLYIACRDIESLIDDRRDEIKSEIDELQEKLSHAIARKAREIIFSEENQVATTRLRIAIKNCENALNGDSIREMVIDQLRDEAFRDVFYSSSGDDIERMRAFDWCETGCEIINMGEG